MYITLSEPGLCTSKSGFIFNNSMFPQIGTTCRLVNHRLAEKMSIHGYENLISKPPTSPFLMKAVNNVRCTRNDYNITPIPSQDYSFNIRVTINLNGNGIKASTRKMQAFSFLFAQFFSFTSRDIFVF